MKYIIILFAVLSPLFAQLNVQTSYTTIAHVVKRIGAENVKVEALASPHLDPHFIVPKPSLIAKLRRADMLIINGGGLEMGWMPPLLKSANNGKIRPGTGGFMDLSSYVNMIDKPQSVSRAFGDVHADGNPHYLLDPHNILNIAKAISQGLSRIDADHADEYARNLERFIHEWGAYLQQLDARMAQCKQKKVVQYHELFNYFLRAYGFQSYGNIEPLPGISASPKHTMELIKTIQTQKIKHILQDVYHEQKTAGFIAEKSDANVILLPHDVGAVDEADTLEHFYDVMAERLCR